ncbi:MAG: glycosyltransferase family 2 protein [Streptomycetaceae bacterium]|nr:glycosyltransferase family 2 protein [Streptomycetaceae bacterium]
MTAYAPLVSVIVPNYNYARALDLCLRALQEQTYPHVEIIMVDDRSTDDSVAVAESLGVRVVQPAVNGGVSKARNFGAAHARGEILFFVDSDVAMDPDAVEQVVASFAGRPEIGAVCGTYRPEPLIRDSLVEEYRNFHQHYWISGFAGRIHDFVHPAMVAVRSHVFAEIGGWNSRLRRTEGSDFGRRVGEHYETWLNPAIRGRHDNDDTLRVVLRKVFIRTRMQISFFRRGRRVADVASSNSARAALLAALTLPAVAVPVLLGPWWTLLPLALLAGSVALDASMYRAAARYKGFFFGVYFASVHYLVNVTIMAAVGVGLIQWLTSERYRRLYDPAAVEPAAVNSATRVAL